MVAAIRTNSTVVPTASVQGAASSVTATTPRISVRVNSCSLKDEHAALTGTTRFLGHWIADTAVLLTTQRYSGQDHAGALSEIRWVFENASRALVSPVLTAYQLLEAWPVGSENFAVEEQREDETELRFRLTFAINADAVT